LVAEKSHNKNVTRINGLETFKINVENLVNKFQVRFACSVSTHHIKEKNAEKTVNLSFFGNSYI
jgi:translation initiation factor 1 (eIF-1/SUI1)